MTAAFRFFQLPLLAKELAERAARRRTYVVRVVYAVLFFGMFVGLVPRFDGPLPVGQLGNGGALVGMLMMLQLVGIHLFLPAIMCGAVAHENETGSLPLLLLTPMSPGRILFQKYVAGLVPMFTFLLLGAPLLAIAYALGGVTVLDMTVCAIVLILATCEVGAFTLLCSVCFRTTVRAFVATYVCGVTLALCTTWLAEWLGKQWEWWGDTPWLLRGGNFTLVMPAGLSAAFSSNPDSSLSIMQSGWLGQFTQWCTPSIALTVGSLLFARIRLQRAGIRPARIRWPRRTWAVTRALRALNARVGGVIFGRRSALPEDQPIAWREGRRFGLNDRAGAFRLGAWITAFAGAVLVVLWAFGAYVLPYEDVDWFSRIGLILAGCAALVMMPYAASAFAAERAGETLPVLLTTPLSAREIVAQKGQFLTRVQLAFIPAIVMLFLAHAAPHLLYPHGAPTDDSVAVWLFSAAPALVIYPQVLAWVGLWIGLFFRTARVALLVSVGLLAVFLFLPDWVINSSYWIVDARPDAHWSDTPLGDVLVHVLSPRQFQTTRMRWYLYVEMPDYWAVATILHYAFYAAVAVAFRWLCLARADRYLRRST